MKKIIDWTIPVKLISEANNTDHWSKKGKRFKAQEWWIKARYASSNITIPLPCIVKFTRIGSRVLDDDNMVHACKHLRDYTSAIIKPGLAPGRADDCKQIQWEYAQKKGEYSVQIEIWA